MKTVSKMELCFNKIQSIKYDNEHGGAYAYLQFMAYSRDLLKVMRPVKSAERQMEAIEGITWLFNEALSGTFSHSQKAMFENKMLETKQIFESVRSILSQTNGRENNEATVFHAQAA